MFPFGYKSKNTSENFPEVFFDFEARTLFETHKVELKIHQNRDIIFL